MRLGDKWTEAEMLHPFWWSNRSQYTFDSHFDSHFAWVTEAFAKVVAMNTADKHCGMDALGTSE